MLRLSASVIVSRYDARSEPGERQSLDDRDHAWVRVARAGTGARVYLNRVKGANWIPDDALLTRLTDNHTARMQSLGLQA